MRKLFLTALVFFVVAIGTVECCASTHRTVCFTSNGEYSCLEAESSTELLKKLENLHLPSGTYEFFIDEASGLKVKMHFLHHKRIKKATLLKRGAKLPKEAIKKLEKDSSQRYYKSKVVIE